MDKLKIIFVNQQLLTQALTHRSYINEHHTQTGMNERLEFLGDAVLEFIVSQKLYHDFPEKEEGYLTALRANLVNTINLAKIAKKLKLGEALLLSRGEEETGGRINDSLLANTFEAITGALFLDQGITKVTQFLEEYLFVDINQKIKEPLKDPKSRLQEIVQAKKEPAPHYQVVSESGPDHNKLFKVAVSVNNNPVAEGIGKSKLK